MNDVVYVTHEYRAPGYPWSGAENFHFWYRDQKHTVPGGEYSQLADKLCELGIDRAILSPCECTDHTWYHGEGGCRFLAALAMDVFPRDPSHTTHANRQGYRISPAPPVR